MKSIIAKLFGSGRGNEVSYEKAKELASHSDAEIRRELASQAELRPEILYFLTEDPSAEVRAEVARNSATPPQADLVLAKDADEMVRGDLAAKISRLAPGLTANEKDQVKVMTYEVLELLARDQVTRVRQIISQTLKDVAHAPPEIIRQLAWDAEVLVSGPILEYSPILSDNDLIEIINLGSATGRLSFIAKREDVSEDVVDAIVETSDEDAVGLLLANKSAQVREETLDKIIDQAIDIESWHVPLVVHPQLSGHAAMRLAKFVANNLLQSLTIRKDIAPEILAEVRSVVNKRLQNLSDEDPENEKVMTPLEEAFEKVSALFENGKLDEAAVLKAVSKQEREFVVAALSVLTDLPIIKMERAIRQKVPKGIVAIIWKAGLSVNNIETLQRDFAGIAEEDILLPNEDEDFPMNEDDLEWQFEAMSEII